MTPADGSKADALPAGGAPRIVTLAGIGGRQPMLAHILASSGVVVEEVTDVPAVLTRLHETPNPDLMVLEWGLSDTRAIEALQDILRSVEEPSLLLLIAPGKADAAARRGPLAAQEFRPGMGGGFREAVKSPDSVVASPMVGYGSEGASLPQSQRQGCAGALSLEASRAYWKGRRVALSLTEFRIVSRLAASPEVDFSHRDIYDLMKGEGVVSGRGEGGYRGNVRAAIKRIRRKFAKIDPGFKAIRNYHGFGYHWDEEDAADTREPTGEATAGGAGG